MRKILSSLMLFYGCSKTNINIKQDNNLSEYKSKDIKEHSKYYDNTDPVKIYTSYLARIVASKILFNYKVEEYIDLSSKLNVIYQSIGEIGYKTMNKDCTLNELVNGKTCTGKITEKENCAGYNLFIAATKSIKNEEWTNDQARILRLLSEIYSICEK